MKTPPPTQSSSDSDVRILPKKREDQSFRLYFFSLIFIFIALPKAPFVSPFRSSRYPFTVSLPRWPSRMSKLCFSYLSAIHSQSSASVLTVILFLFVEGRLGPIENVQCQAHPRAWLDGGRTDNARVTSASTPPQPQLTLNHFENILSFTRTAGPVRVNHHKKLFLFTRKYVALFLSAFINPNSRQGGRPPRWRRFGGSPFSHGKTRTARTERLLHNVNGFHIPISKNITCSISSVTSFAVEFGIANGALFRLGAVLPTLLQRTPPGYQEGKKMTMRVTRFFLQSLLGAARRIA